MYEPRVDQQESRVKCVFWKLGGDDVEVEALPYLGSLRTAKTAPTMLREPFLRRLLFLLHINWIYVASTA